MKLTFQYIHEIGLLAYNHAHSFMFLSWASFAFLKYLLIYLAVSSLR